jgi:UPF0042 nucleotide-binding protein
MSQDPRVLVVTGMSGAGKSSVLKVLEDLGWEAVDNLPLSLLPRLAGNEGGSRPIAVGLDSRTRGFDGASLRAALEQLREAGTRTDLLFLDCDDDILHNRFTATRRLHPLAADRPVTDGIALERGLLVPVRAQADLTIDTSRLRLPDLRARIVGEYAPATDSAMVTTIVSFSYRHGLPREADLVFDARFLRNPFYEPLLRPLSGEDAAVGAHVAGDPAFAPFFADLTRLLGDLLPAYEAAGKRYLTVAIGCTGGRHRSVYLASRLANELENGGFRPVLRHRDISLGGE